MPGDTGLFEMIASIKIDSPDSKIKAIKAVSELNDETSYVLEIKEHKKNRSVAANRLYWLWLTDLERTSNHEYQGHHQEWWHDFFKREKLSKIFERDSDRYAQTLASIREVYRHGLHTQALNMHDFVIAETSTTDANVEQFAEYLTFIERWAHERGLSLRTDSEIYREAMGK